MVAASRFPSNDPDPRPRPSTPNQIGSLIELGLRGPTLGILQRQGILTVEQLTRLTPDELMGVRRVGLSRMLEIRQALQAHGIDLIGEESTPAIRVWAESHRVRLLCCDRGDCVLDVRTAGARPEDLSRVKAAFVDTHRACPRLAGREPIVNTTDTTRPVAFGSEGLLPESAPTGPERLASDKQPA